ncbi:MAG TPA: LPS export ABC transporter permease LptF [Kiloniellales bacterium]|nr:LPS export ABC transporter permease LptF [Kiloniellales bacterium]
MAALTRYILRQSTFAAVFVTLALTFALWLTQSLRMLDYLVNRGLPASQFFELILLLLPKFVAVTLSIGTVIGALFVFNKLTQDSEIVVMRAAGMSSLQLARPVVWLGLGAMVILYALTLYFMPLANRNFKDMQVDARHSYISALIQEGVFNSVGRQVMVYIRGRDEEGALVDLLLHDQRDRTRPVTLTAERGALVRDGEEGGLRVLLLHGTRQEIDRQTGEISMLSFDQYTVDLDSFASNRRERFRNPDERFLSELIHPTQEELEEEGFREELLAELHQRLTLPLYPLAFTLIGLVALLSGDFSRRSQPWRMVTAAVAIGILQGIGLAIDDITSRAGDTWPLMYMAPLLPIVVCLLVLSRSRLGLRRSARRLQEVGA